MKHEELQYEVNQWANNQGIAPSLRLQILQLQIELQRNLLLERIAVALEVIKRLTP